MALHYDDENQKNKPQKTDIQEKLEQALGDKGNTRENNVNSKFSSYIHDDAPVKLGWDQISDSVLNVNYSCSQNLSDIQNTVSNFIAKELQKNINVEVIGIDKESHKIGADVLVFAVKQTINNAPHVAYYSMIVGAEPSNIVFNDNRGNQRRMGDNNERIVLPSDYYDEVLLNAIWDFIVEYYKTTVNPKNIISADGTVVPVEFDFNDQNMLKSLVRNAFMAIDSALSKALHLKDLNVKQIQLQKGEQQVQSIKFGNDSELDAVGSPVRADISIAMMLTRNEQYGSTITSPNQRPVKQDYITRATGYMDILFSPSNTQQGWLGQNVDKSGINACYTGVFILTSLLCLKKQSLAGTLLALINASYLSENNTWIQAFKPRPDSLPMHDLGNLGYELKKAQDGSTLGKFSTDPAQFPNEDFLKFMEYYFHRNIMLAIDIPDAGPTSWMLSTIFQCAITNPNDEFGAAARAEIRQAMDTLTNGNFSRVYRGDNTLFTTNNTRIVLGQYEDKGRVADARELDYIAVAGIAGKAKDMSILDQWSDTFSDINAPLEFKAEKRLKIMKNILPSFKPNGFGVRAYVEPAFIIAAKEALAACGYTVYSNLSYSSGLTGTRATANFVNDALMSNSGSGIFVTDNKFSNQGGGYRNVFGRGSFFSNI